MPMVGTSPLPVVSLGGITRWADKRSNADFIEVSGTFRSVRRERQASQTLTIQINRERRSHAQCRTNDCRVRAGIMALTLKSVQGGFRVALLRCRLPGAQSDATNIDRAIQ